MQKFAEYLNKYLIMENISYSKAAELCGMDRTLLRRYTKGERIPRNINKVLKIAQGLSMSSEMTEELCMSYKLSKMQEIEYNTMEKMDQIFNCDLINNSKGSCKNDIQESEWEIEQVKRIKGIEEINSAMKYVVTQAEYLKVKMKAEHIKLIEKMLWFDIPEYCRIEQIYQMEHRGLNIEEDRISEFEKLFPFFLYGRNLKIYYSDYQDASLNDLEGNEMLLLSDKGCIICSTENMQGVFVNKSVYLKWYHHGFQQSLENCRLFGMNIENHHFMLQMEYEKKCSLSDITFLYQDKPIEQVWLIKGNGEYGMFCIIEKNFVQILHKYIVFHMK